jgi:hypothetical protein
MLRKTTLTKTKYKDLFPSVGVAGFGGGRWGGEAVGAPPRPRVAGRWGWWGRVPVERWRPEESAMEPDAGRRGGGGARQRHEADDGGGRAIGGPNRNTQ